MPQELRTPRARDELQRSAASLEQSLVESEHVIHRLADDIGFLRRHAAQLGDISSQIAMIRRECERWMNLRAHIENVQAMLK